MAAGGAPPVWMQGCVLLLLLLPLLLLLLLLCPSEAESNRNYYQVLDIEPTATESQIKKAFRKLAVKHHPDKNKGADAEKTFREIAEAYSVLSNQEKRRLYDSMDHEAFLKNEVSLDAEDEDVTSFHFTFSDFFHDFDGGPFVEEPHLHWSFFHQDWEEEEEDGPYEHFGSEDPDGDEHEEDYY
ncbi:hypothetical protein INR49_020512 [Caranx melampygus]|nr:hypothetical protein INR49_020512 [Caranx melampygus]